MILSLKSELMGRLMMLFLKWGANGEVRLGRQG